MKKTCKKCQKLLGFDQFHKKLGKPIAICKTCVAPMQREYYLKNRDKKLKRAREYRNKHRERINFLQRKRLRENLLARRENISKLLMRNYGINLEFKEKLLEFQRGRCDICDCVLKNTSSAFVDHDHDTGFIRGLLCKHCNSAIGLLKEDYQIMKRAIEYIDENQSDRNGPLDNL